jgi:hypothetical protein
MKIEYKNIIGTDVNGVYFCDECCFACLAWDCIPYTLHRCVKHIFKESNTQIFNL